MPHYIKLFSVSNFIILITVIMFGVQNYLNNGIIVFGLNSLFLEYGFYWQPLSSIFSHGGIGHIFMNMFILFQLGNLIETKIGKINFFILYIFSGLLVSACSYAFLSILNLNHNLVGASGAICALAGFISLKDKSQRQGMIAWALLISFAPLLLGLPIAWYSHIFGFIFGWIFGYIL